MPNLSLFLSLYFSLFPPTHRCTHTRTSPLLEMWKRIRSHIFSPPTECKTKTLILFFLLTRTSLLLTWSERWPHKVFYIVRKINQHIQIQIDLMHWHQSQVRAGIIDADDSSAYESAKKCVFMTQARDTWLETHFCCSAKEVSDFYFPFHHIDQNCKRGSISTADNWIDV